MVIASPRSTLVLVCGDPAMSEPPKIRAAQYLRMSTEHQRYSLKNQAEAIDGYAELHGYEVVRTYFDPGKSGLTLKQRKGLQALLADALSPDRDFSAVLVLDVSRWGRFQDADQAAHYEFLCREAGLALVYCAEPFPNDGTAMSALMKHIKRIMAAEFSRELSEKVRFAHRRLAGLGHHQGGPLPYGFRRLAVDGRGRVRGVLQPFHWKSVATDHVVLAPGSPEEQDVVRWIFRQYVRQGETTKSLSKKLNQRGVPTNDNRPWSRNKVTRVLRNELAIGVYVFGKTSTHLRGRKRPTPADTWLRVRVSDAIVSQHLFRKAEQKRRSRRHGLMDDDMLLHGLERLLSEKGRVSRTLIDRCPYLPTSQTILNHFGSISSAYERIGYTPERRWRNFREDDQKMLEGIRTLYDAHGYITMRLINAEPTLPNSSCYLKHFGSMLHAYELAGVPHHRSEIQRRAYQRSVDRCAARSPNPETSGG
jgi:DNA invertase Pin-like site-specific DNA recombinase